MKAPTNVLPALDIDGIRAGDRDALADAIQAMWGAHNDQATALGQRIGNWQDVPFDAAMFVGLEAGRVNPGNWAVSEDDAEFFRFIRVDDWLILNLNLLHTVITGGNVQMLKILLPAGLVPLERGSATFFGSGVDGVGYFTGLVSTGSIGYIQVVRQDNTNYAAGALEMGFSMTFQIESPSGH